MERFRRSCCRLLSLLLNATLVYFETIAAPISWEGVGMQMFTFYTEDSNLFATAVCALVALCQVVCLFTDKPLPFWVKRLKFVATTCLTMTFLTVVFILAPYYGEGGYYVMLLTSSMLYHHFLNPLLAIASFVLFEREPRLSGWNVPLTLVPTVGYGAVVLWANLTYRMDGPYPFMRVYDQTVQESVFWFCVVLGSNLSYAWLLWRLGGNKKKR